MRLAILDDGAVRRRDRPPSHSAARVFIRVNLRPLTCDVVVSCLNTRAGAPLMRGSIAEVGEVTT